MLTWPQQWRHQPTPPEQWLTRLKAPLVQGPNIGSGAVPEQLIQAPSPSLAPSISDPLGVRSPRISYSGMEDNNGGYTAATAQIDYQAMIYDYMLTR